MNFKLVLKRFSKPNFSFFHFELKMRSRMLIAWSYCGVVVVVVAAFLPVRKLKWKTSTTTTTHSWWSRSLILYNILRSFENPPRQSKHGITAKQKKATTPKRQTTNGNSIFAHTFFSAGQIFRGWCCFFGCDSSFSLNFPCFFCWCNGSLYVVCFFFSIQFVFPYALFFHPVAAI